MTKTHHHVGGEQLLDLKELALVKHGLDDRLHVIRLVGAVRNEGVEGGVLLGQFQLGRSVPTGRVAQVVLRQELQQVLHVVDGVVLVRGEVVRHSGLDVVCLPAAKLLKCDLFTRHGLDDVRTGDEHLRGAVRHHDEVSERGGVHGAAGTGTQDDGDLRDHTGRRHVAAEDFRELRERRNAFLDACPATVADANERHARAQRKVLNLGDFLPVHFAKRAAKHREVLAVNGHLAAVDGAVAGHNAVAVRPVLLQPKVLAAVAREAVQFHKRAVIKQGVNALAGGLLAARVLLCLGG